MWTVGIIWHQFIAGVDVHSWPQSSGQLPLSLRQSCWDSLACGLPPVCTPPRYHCKMPLVLSFPTQGHASVVGTCLGWLPADEPAFPSNLGQTPCRSAVCCTSLTGGAHTMWICRTTYPMPIECLSDYPFHSCKPSGLCPSVDLPKIAKPGS